MRYHALTGSVLWTRFLVTFLPAVVILGASALTASAQVHAWSLAYQNTDTVYSFDVTTDADGNVYATGWFNGTVDFGDGPHLSQGSSDVFLVKYDPYGGCLWSRTFGNTYGDGGAAVGTDLVGNVYLTGNFRHDVDFGGGALLNAGWHYPNWPQDTMDIFIAKYDSNGNHLWSYGYGDSKDDIVTDLAVDGPGNLSITGYFDWDLDFGGGPLSTAGNITDGFLASFDTNGSFRWNRSFGSSGVDKGLGVAIDGSGNVIMTGSFLRTVGFGGTGLTAQGTTGGSFDRSDVFLAKYDSSGIFQWSQKLGCGEQDEGYDVAADGAGNIAMTGYFGAAVLCNYSWLIPVGGRDMFLATFDATGTNLWGRSFATAGDDLGKGVAFDTAGNLVMTGSSTAAIDFGGGLFPNAGYADIVMASFDPIGTHLWSRSFAGAGYDYGQDVVLLGNNELWLTGTLQQTVDFGGGPLSSYSSSTDGFLAKFMIPQPVPIITGVSDVPDDEGGFVTVDFVRSVYDDPGSASPVLSYEIYRKSRIDWIPVLVGTLPAKQWETYSLIVPTAFDYGSSPFRVDALTSVATYSTPYSSGASVDNLAPATPTGVSAAYQASGVLLDWNDSPEPDLQLYRVYRDTDPFFVPSPVNLIQEITASTWTDATANPWGWRYKVSAVDTANNEGPAGPVTTTTDAPGVGVTRSLTLYDASPNPFNPSTSIRYSLPAAGKAELVIYDTTGHEVLTLVNEWQGAGMHAVRWNGRDQKGRRVASGVYFYQLRAGSRTDRKRMTLLK